MPQAPEITVLVSTFERPRHLRRCLLSLAGQQGVAGKFEVIVVDDGSRDETPDVVARFAAEANFPVRFLTHPHNGFQLARCRNAGIRAAAAPYILFTDGDCIFPPDHLRQHLAARRPGVVRAGDCLRLDEASSDAIDDAAALAGSYVAAIDPLARKFYRSTYLKALVYQLYGHPRRPKLVGNNMAMWRQQLDRVNGFDERYRGWGCEDDDLRARLRDSGVRIRTVLGYTRGYHLWHAPDATAPKTWREGVNVGYYRRPLRLIGCVEGLRRRGLDELAVRTVAGSQHAALAQDVASMFRRPAARAPSTSDRLEIEILFWPCPARFSAKAECRVLVVRQGTAVPRSVKRAAGIVVELGDKASASAVLDELRRHLVEVGPPQPSAHGGMAAA